MKTGSITSKTSQSYFLVRHTDESVPEKYHVHFSSVLIEVDHDANANAYISDCNSTAYMGRNNASDPGKDFSFRLAALIKAEFHNATLYTSIEGRQSDKSNCPIFSLHDVLQMQKHGGITGIIRGSEIRKLQNESFDSALKIDGIVTLPFGMMKATQSLKKLIAYQNSLLMPKEKDKVNMSVEKHTVSIDGRKVNGYIANKYIDYERYILSSD